MTNLIEFPGLGISLELSRVAFTIFGMPIYWYGVCIGFGMVLAVLFAFSQCNRFGIDGDRMVDVIIIGLICAIAGGRLYYVVFIDSSYDTFIDMINLRNGGIAIYGAIIGAFIGAAIASKWRKVPVLPMFDLAGIGFLIGQSIGRWGNFFNQEAFGTNTNLPWGMISPTTTYFLESRQMKLAMDGIMVDPSLPVHPTFLYESIWCAIGFLLLFLYRKKRKFNGEMFLLYVMWYGLGRFFIEGLRTDALMMKGLGLPVSQVLAAVSVMAALAIWIMARVKTKGKSLQVPEIPPHRAVVKVETEQGEEEVTIEWPANSKEPNKAARLEMAKKKLEEEKCTESLVDKEEDGVAEVGNSKEEVEEKEEPEKQDDPEDKE